MDKTVKISAYTPPAKELAPQANIAKDMIVALELEQKQAQLDEERNKSLELLRSVVQLRESLKQEQAKSAGFEEKINEMSVLEESQLIRKNVQLEEEKNKLFDQTRLVEQLRESLKQEQSKNAEMVDRLSKMEAEVKEISIMQIKLDQLSLAFGKISSLVEVTKSVGWTNPR